MKQGAVKDGVDVNEAIRFYEVPKTPSWQEKYGSRVL
jgi:hypothetical protein